MSYSFTIKVENGEVTPVISEGMAKHIPDGTFYISGHEDSRSTSIHISRNRADGSQAAMVNTGTVTHTSADNQA